MPFLQDTPRVTKNLIIVNIIVYLATLVNEPLMIKTFARFYPASQMFRWWQPGTHLFMHGGFWHLFFNMYTLYIFGCVVERMIGERKFLWFYFLCGLGAAALHCGVEYLQAVGYLKAIADGTAGAAQAYATLKMIPTVGASLPSRSRHGRWSSSSSGSNS